MPIKCLNESCPYFDQGDCGRRSQNNELSKNCIDRVLPSDAISKPEETRKASRKRSRQGRLDERELAKYVWVRWGQRGAAFLCRCLRGRRNGLTS